MADLSQYSSYAFHVTAPAGEDVVVQNPGTTYVGALSGTAYGGSGQIVTAGGTASLTFDNLTGSFPVSSTAAYYDPVNGITGTVDSVPLSGGLTFTGFTVTLSGFPTVPSGLATWTNSIGSSQFEYSTLSPTDPGAFVSLQPIPASTPEPGCIAMTFGAVVQGAALLYRRRRKMSAE